MRFRVNVADLVHRPGARRHERVTGRLVGLRVVDTAVPPDGDVTVDAILEWVSDGVLATGDVEGEWESECRRCLTPVRGSATVEFRELFEPTPREGETYPLRNDQIDLEPLAREALLVDLPLAPLCRPDCRGLCPVCGVDRNADPSHSHDAETDSRWSALDSLRGVLDEGD